jgi:hypothetical protein
MRGSQTGGRDDPVDRIRTSTHARAGVGRAAGGAGTGRLGQPGSTRQLCIPEVQRPEPCKRRTAEKASDSGTDQPRRRVSGRFGRGVAKPFDGEGSTVGVGSGVGDLSAAAATSSSKRNVRPDVVTALASELFFIRRLPAGGCSEAFRSRKGRGTGRGREGSTLGERGRKGAERRCRRSTLPPPPSPLPPNLHALPLIQHDRLSPPS